MPTWPVKVVGGHLSLPASTLLCEHVDSVLSEWIGMSPKEIEKLREDGAV